MDACHKCQRNRAIEANDPLYGLGIPVAISGIENNREWVSVRCICPRCRSVWDCSQAVDNSVSELSQFEDRYIRGYEEGLSAPPMGGVPFPAGPTRLFQRNA